MRALLHFALEKCHNVFFSVSAIIRPYFFAIICKKVQHFQIGKSEMIVREMYPFKDKHDISI